MTDDPPERSALRKPRRRLRAAFVADIENYSGRVSIGETLAFHNTTALLEGMRQEVEQHAGEIITTPGDGMVVLFESAVDAVRCALATHARVGDGAAVGGMRLRIGIHLGEVILEGPAPMGEPINVAVRLQSIAATGSTLITEDVLNAVATRIQARFTPKGYPSLRNIPRRIAVYEMLPVEAVAASAVDGADTLDKTTRFNLKALARVDQSDRVPSMPGAQTIEDARPVGSPVPVVPARAKDGGQQSPASADTPFDAAAVAPEMVKRLVALLATHIGPVAPVLYRRAARDAAALDDLVARLADGIPVADERVRFRTEANRILRGA